MKSFSEMADSAGRIDRAINRVGRKRLENAFINSTFVYGTTGGAFMGSAIERWRAYMLRNRKAHNKAVQSGSSGGGLVSEDMRKLNFYDPGPRTKVALDNQMMDLYYGQEGTSIHLSRNRTIGEYVHYAMSFFGFYDHRISGRDAYLNSFGKHPDQKGGFIEGWASWPRPPNGFTEFEGFYYPDPDNSGKGISATKEMSRIIRTGIYELGGTLIFEGTNVTYQSVFVIGAYVSDTSLEAENLFKFFTPGKSRVKFGNGELVFHWHGKETIPSLALFHSNWYFFSPPDGKPLFHKMQNQRRADSNEVLKPIYSNFVKVSVMPE